MAVCAHNAYSTRVKRNGTSAVRHIQHRELEQRPLIMHSGVLHCSSGVKHLALLGWDTPSTQQNFLRESCWIASVNCHKSIVTVAVMFPALEGEKVISDV